MKSDDINASLLKECYSMLEDIENDGWIIRGGKSAEIPRLLSHMRQALYTPIDYIEKTAISFDCIATKCLFVINAEHDNKDIASQIVECDGCGKLYRVTWKNGDIATFVIACDEEKR